MSDRAHDGEEIGLETFDSYRALLLSISYRMLGTLSDAEDIVQDAFIRWQHAPKQSIESPRAYLVTIVSRLCLDYLKSARIRREQYVGSWLPEPLLTDTRFPLDSPPDDSLSMAFLLLLERLSPPERAVFLLREVFEYEYGEIARILGQTEPSCRQILRRAKQHVSRNRPRFHPSHEQQTRLFDQFLKASSSGNMDQLVSLLHDEVILYADGGGKTTAVPRPIYGAHNVARFMLRAPRKLVPELKERRFTEINGQPAIVTYIDRRPHSVFTAEIASDRIRSIYIVANPDKLSRLPLMS